MGGVYLPGDVLTLRGLAAAFGTSLMPVRSAVSRLSVEHALDVLPNRSISIPRLTRAQFDEVTDIRLALEPMAAQLAVRRIDKASVKKLATLAEDMEAAEADPSAYLRHNMAFHFTLYAFARRPMLEQLIKGSWLRVGPLFHSLEHTGFDLPGLHHGAVVDALKQRDHDAVAASIAADISDAATALRTSLPE